MPRTVSPSSMPVYSPMMMMPTLSASRLKARPMTLSLRPGLGGNSTNSMAITPARPSARAMPSPTSITEPTSTACEWGLKLLDLFLENRRDVFGL